MKRSISAAKWSASWLALSLISGGALAQAGKVDMGKQEFDASCAVCHGNSGAGNGPFLPYLRSSPPDLTTLAKRNGGVFPVNRVFETIEGGNVPGHSVRDMPVWGKAYRTQAGEHYVDMPYDPAVYVRSRVLALVEYINRLQGR